MADCLGKEITTDDSSAREKALYKEMIKLRTASRARSRSRSTSSFDDVMSIADFYHLVGLRVTQHDADCRRTRGGFTCGR